MSRDWKLILISLALFWGLVITGCVAVTEPEITNGTFIVEVREVPELPDVQTLDEQGNVTGTIPETFHMPHQWAGWPV